MVHKVDPHGLSRFDSIFPAKTLSDSFCPFLQSLLRPPFPCFPERFIAGRAEAGNGDLLVASWIFSSELKVDITIDLLVPALAPTCSVRSQTHLSADRLPTCVILSRISECEKLLVCVVSIMQFYF